CRIIDGAAQQLIVGKCEPVPTYAHIECEGWEQPIVILEKERQICGSEIALWITRGGLLTGDLSIHKIRKGTKIQGSTNRKLIEAIELKAVNFTSGLEIVFAETHGPCVTVNEAICNRTPLVVHSRADGKCAGHIHSVYSGNGAGVWTSRVGVA